MFPNKQSKQLKYLKNTEDVDEIVSSLTERVSNIEKVYKFGAVKM